MLRQKQHTKTKQQQSNKLAKKSTKKIAKRVTKKVTKRNMSTHTAKTSPVHADAEAVLSHFGIKPNHPGILIGTEAIQGSGRTLEIKNPTTGDVISTVNLATAADYAVHVKKLNEKRAAWAKVPAPRRGEIVRQIGDELRKEKANLAKIISMEMGKIYQEALGEVQESIDICDFAVGLSRQIGGSVFPSERANHTMMEQWHPLTGNVAIITAFNFPNAVYFWNAALSLICGNTQLLKPAPSGSLIALASAKIVNDVLARHGFAEISGLFLGEADVGSAITNDPQNTLVSFTGSTHVGRQVAVDVAKRFGKHILELGGNNAVFVFPDADLDMAVRSSLFSAVGTCGQRCTSLRRLYIHEDVYDKVVPALVEAYKGVAIGDPLVEGTLCGPLHTEAALKQFEAAIAKVGTQGGKVLIGGERITSRPGNFVYPAIAEMPTDAEMVKEELFAPLLYVMKFKSLSEAIELNNSVDQGLSSAIFTRNQAAVYHWLGATGSDCGIANVNIGTSGAEIGGAFGGEKATGGGRESGSDAWKGYMRRQTSTINYGNELPLAQGIVFSVDAKAESDPKYIPNSKVFDM
eukprot:UN02502